MSSRKNKNKNRQNKPPNVNLLQKPNVIPKPSETNVEKFFEEKTESVLKLEECTSEVVSDIGEVRTTQPIESKELETNAPKKPKRNRGKKKKQDEYHDFEVTKEPLHVSEFILEDKKVDPEIENNENEALECKETVEAVSIMPVARKKKNKNKKDFETEIEIGHKYDDGTSMPETKSQKSIEKEKELQIESKEIYKKSFDEMKEEKMLPKTVEATEQESKSKKRNKKKKHRNDLEKSDNTEEINSSNTAFEKLPHVLSEYAINNEMKMKMKNQESLVNQCFKSNTKDVEIIKEVTIKTDLDLITEKNTTALEKVTEQKVLIEQELKDNSAKTKKKYKKEKKQDVKLQETQEQGCKNDEEMNSPRSSSIDISMESTLKSEHKDDIKAEIPIQPSSAEKFEKENPKPKAKIAKPVQKKSKDKMGVESALYFPENFESTTDIKLPLIEIESDLADAQNVTAKSKNIIKSEETLKREIIGIKEERITLESEMREKRENTPKLPINLNLPTEISESVTNLDSAFFLIDEKCKIILTDETGKQETESTKSLPIESVEVSSAKAEDLEGLIFDNIPDFIEYPRSTSEQLDDNNNMIIQEITLIEEVKSDPPSEKAERNIFQTSDESPIKSPEVVPGDLKVLDMETKIITTKEEKTDLKSKVMEVNQDMEDLKLSIEKSLAELTAMETAEKRVEKQFEETTKYKTEGIEKTELKQNISDSKIVDKVTCDAFGKETFFPKKREQDSNIDFNEQSKHEKYFDMPKDLVCPERKDNKGKGKSKKKGKQEAIQISVIADSKDSECKDFSESNKESEKSQEKRDNADDKSKKHSTHSVEGTSDSISADSVLSVVVDSKGTSETKEKLDATEQRTEYTEDKSKKQSIQSVENFSDKKGKDGSSSTQITVIIDSEGTSSKDFPQTNEVMQDAERKATTIEDTFKIQSVKPFEEKSEDNSTDNIIFDEAWQSNYEPIENFEDALTSSADDVNKTFEMLASDANHALASQSNVQIHVIAPTDDKGQEDEKQRQEKENPVSQPKNLLGRINIPVPSNKTDYKKEKNKTPNSMQAKAKIKDSVPIEDIQKSKKQSKESQTESKRKSNDKVIKESMSCIRNGNEEYIYKYSFRKVFLSSACHVCKKDLNKKRVPCNFCNLLFYCNQKHKDEDWPQHQALCFAISTIIHLKKQKHIYADAKNVTGQNYRLLRMQMIVSCEKVLKRKLVPWEQEAMLYPRICADVGCREWRQEKLKDCETCGQISYCIEHPEHLPISHQRWCNSYNLYQKLVCYQQTKGRLEPKLPTRVMADTYVIPEKINEVLASLYEEKIDMNDMQYAALTQLATAPLTTAFCYQLYNNRLNASYANGVNKKSSFTLHIVGAELQFEADALNKWEIFLLHLKPDVTDLRVVFIGHQLNPSNLPLDLLGKITLCNSCRENKRRMLFSFQDRMSYHQYWASDDFVSPDIVCAFNSSLQNLSPSQNGKDAWTITIDCIMKLKIPFVLTSYTLSELRQNLAKIKESSELQFNIISEPKFNSFANVRPDRNFISDDEMPLLFKNYCYTVICRDF